jgi:hypothetical protein
MKNVEPQDITPRYTTHQHTFKVESKKNPAHNSYVLFLKEKDNNPLGVCVYL